MFIDILCLLSNSNLADLYRVRYACLITSLLFSKYLIAVLTYTMTDIFRKWFLFFFAIFFLFIGIAIRALLFSENEIISVFKSYLMNLRYNSIHLQ
jgi:hypothetical protein